MIEKGLKIKSFQIKTAAVVVVLSCISPIASAYSARALSQIKLVTTHKSDYYQILETQKIQPIKAAATVDMEAVKLYIPMNLQSGANGGYVARKILQRSINALFRKTRLKNMRIIKAAQKLDQKLSTNINLKSKNKNGKQTHHKFFIQMRALESIALVKYSGWLYANLSYSLSSKKANLEVYQNISAQTRLTLNQSVSPSESRSYVSIQLNY